MPSAESYAPLEGAPQHPGAPRGNRRQLLSAIAALIVLLGLLSYVVGRNYLRDQGRHAQDTSDFVQQERAAIRETKTAFAETYSDSSLLSITALVDEVANPTPPAHSDKIVKPQAGPVTPGAPKTPGPLNQPSGSVHPSSLGPKASESKAIVANLSARSALRRWGMLANSPSARPSVLRRQGITLFLFHQPGGMDAFRRIPLLPPAKTSSVPQLAKPGSVPAKPTPPAARGLSFAEEGRLWDAIYGPVAPRPAEAPSLRAKLARLNLGWFENIAAATLYNRAGMTAEAALATRQARQSADVVVTVLGVEGVLPIAGVVLMLGYLGTWLMRQVVPARQTTTDSYSASDPNSLAAFYAPPAASLDYSLASAAPAERNEPRSQFSFNTRVITFVVFFACYLLISWPLRSIMPLIVHWNNRDALRLSMILELAAYVPVVAITLLVFKRLGERDANRCFTWRETLSALGLWTTRPVGDLFVALGAYSMTIPAIYLAALVSIYLFRGFHTPVHPVDTILLGTQDDLTRALVVIQAVIAAPIVEELTFRGLLFEGLRQRWGLAAGAVFSSAVFALSHNTLPGGFLMLWTLGFSFALVYRCRGSIVPNILMHAFHNGLVTLLTLAVFSH